MAMHEASVKRSMAASVAASKIGCGTKYSPVKDSCKWSCRRQIEVKSVVSPCCRDSWSSRSGEHKRLQGQGLEENSDTISVKRSNKPVNPRF